jgi:5,10-methylene-tetrahydrofolate dehydrogenase/methenyl tetrahydrofolate cyclohydrolase
MNLWYHSRIKEKMSKLDEITFFLNALALISTDKTLEEIHGIIVIFPISWVMEVEERDCTGMADYVKDVWTLHYPFRIDLWVNSDFAITLWMESD